MHIKRLAVIVFVLAVAPISASELVLNPFKDNTLIYSADGSLSDGAGQHVFAGRTNQGSPADLRRGLLDFDVSAIPTGATINSVTLTLYLDRTSDTLNRNVSVYRMLQDWGEGTSDAGGVGTGGGGGAGAPATNNDATWLYRFYNATNPTSSPAWTTPGGDFVSTASAVSSIGNIQNAAVPYLWSGPGLVSDVQAWVNGTVNDGWILVGDETVAGSVRRFESRNNINNGTGGNPDYCPTLDIIYTVPEPASAVLLGSGLVWLLFRRKLCSSLR